MRWRKRESSRSAELEGTLLQKEKIERIKWNVRLSLSGWTRMLKTFMITVKIMRKKE